MKFSKVITSVAMAVFLTACGYSPENVKVVEIYSGKKMQLYERLTEEEKSLLNEYIVRSTFGLRLVRGNETLYSNDTLMNNVSVAVNKDGANIKIGSNESTIEFKNNNSTINANNAILYTNDNRFSVGVVRVGGGDMVLINSIVSSPEQAKEVMGNTTVAEALVLQKQYRLQKAEQEKALADKKAEVDKMVAELDKVLKTHFAEKEKGPDVSNPTVNLLFSFTNTTKKDVKLFRGIFEFYDTRVSPAQHFYRLRITHDEGVKAGKSVIYDGEAVVDFNNVAEKVLWDIPSDYLDVKFTTTDVVFSDDTFLGDPDVMKVVEYLNNKKIVKETPAATKKTN